MILKRRKLIVYQASEIGSEIYDELYAYDWDAYFAKDLQQLSDLTDAHQFEVGLYFVEEKCSSKQCLIGKPCLINQCANTQELTQLNQLFNFHGKGINWIMGIPTECNFDAKSNPVKSKLISENCSNFIVHPFNIGRLLIALNNAYGVDEFLSPFQKYITHYPSNFGIIGNSPPMVDLFRLLKKVANEDCSVLIEGETGTGKELVANAIHNNSSRSAQPLIAINCGAFPKDLIQAELFGHEKGAFTGALQRKIGRIESAQGGTLFLDEIGDLPFEQQINLLRFLEDRTIQRIGGSEKISIDVRVIAASHVDLKAAVQRKEFREDLYYRLQVLQVRTPSLRVREDDIELLAYYYFNKFSANGSYKAKGFDTDSLYLLKNYDWPGNVRQLMNCIRNALVTSENRLLTPRDLGIERRYKERTLQTLEQARAIAERESIITCLRHTNNNMSRAAEVLGISRVSLYRLADKHKLNA